ncbi:prolyl oligopeptidase-like protein [Dactylonectria estremocensis]|uniref:Prolyl oligopeptidase-like protein n=1 Tax=Dactylonectria estremocensis TaxID=1079267 RepID=A0A9P9EG09_9HYPO|nr:prolyl oligopeptidase-like protein [Dactylonectria estremocensis]
MRSFTPYAALGHGITLLAALAPIVNGQLYGKTIQTSLGPVKGFKAFNESDDKYFDGPTSNVAAFLGIPYAADTGYENRWKAPQPREHWNETLLAYEFGAQCPTGRGTSSEDCLSVNVWTNASSSSDKLPVLVWNQGSEMTSDNSWWYGGGMAVKGVVMVSFNRRDDVLGYLAHPELNAEGKETTGHETSGNYGVLDHLEVLKWVQKNIEKFGGDPDSVTIAGQSFGSSQVYHAVNSGLFSGLFHRGIAQSGIRYPYDTLLAGLATSYVTMEKAIQFGLNYTANHNVSSIAELRKLPVEEILVGSTDRDNSVWWVTALSCGTPLIFKPVLDGYVLPMKYIEQLKKGPANDVPLITGNTKDESGASLSTNYTVAEYTEYCTLKYGNLSSRYFELYPVDGNATQGDLSWNAAARDTSLVSSWAYAKDWILSAESPIYTYYWDHAPPGQDQGAFHQSEIMYALNALYANTEKYPFTSQDYTIQEFMTAYWVNFIKTGNPNNGGGFTGNGTLAQWFPNSGETNYVMRLGNGFGNHTVAPTKNVELLMDYLLQQVPY